MQHQDQTIFALATSGGRSAVQIIRVSGGCSKELLKRHCGKTFAPRYLTLAKIYGDGEKIIDTGMVAFFPAPNSPTGEDYAEFHLHGNPLIARHLMRCFAADAGCRLAEAGEFSRRAFVNGKMTLDQAEALADLIDADTAAQHRQALARLDQPLSDMTISWRQCLIKVMARLEVVLDFADEDIPASLGDEIIVETKNLITLITSTLEGSARGALIRDGLNITIIGRPNAGKSTLLNTLAASDEAIVSAEEGTTRDVIKVTLDMGGFAVNLIDTAGIRLASSDAEKQGVHRAIKAAVTADIVLVLVDHAADDPETVLQQVLAESGLDQASKTPEVLKFLSRADLPAPADTPRNWRRVSAKTGEGIDVLRDDIKIVMDLLVGDGEAALVSRERHRIALESCRDALINALSHDIGWSAELMAEDFRQAALCLGRVSGHIDVEDVLESVFSSFCIGK